MTYAAKKNYVGLGVEVHSDVELDSTVLIGSFVKIAQGVKTGKRIVIHANTTIDRNADIGNDCVIGPYCYVGAEVQLPPRTHMLRFSHAYWFATKDDARLTALLMAHSDSCRMVPITNGVVLYVTFERMVDPLL